jgi:hypothetical protein
MPATARWSLSDVRTPTLAGVRCVRRRFRVGSVLAEQGDANLGIENEAPSGERQYGLRPQMALSSSLISFEIVPPAQAPRKARRLAPRLAQHLADQLGADTGAAFVEGEALDS